MYLYNKRDIVEVKTIANDIADKITSFGDDIVNELQDADRDIELLESKMSSLEKSIKDLLHRDGVPFSKRLKNRIERYIENRFDINDISLDLQFEGLQERDILESYDSYNSGLDYLDDNLGFTSTLEEFKESADTYISFLEKIESFLSNPTIKTRHFVVEIRAGIIAIKDRKHPSYRENRRGDILLSNPEVYYVREGIFDSNGWSVPVEMIEEFKEIAKKLNSLS